MTHVMNNQPAPTNPEIDDRTSPTTIQEQHLNLKLEVEQVYRKVDRLQTTLQTLLSGLLVATLIAVGVATWFAYRLLLEEKIAQQEVKKTIETQAEIIERLDRLEEQIQSQERKIKRLSEDIPPELGDRLEEDRQELQKFRDRLNRLEKINPEKQLND
ncbi:hypothetical protein [Spirulina sp. 06S082]|uniref:hypothetical protein n=1 Tax=Spirulina sp. 06S082 TaxID=3110248 RepID=UPI002B20BB6A|nr:hypothetical protein [Spirulina sp. 06S082]MEA5469020.1 hypothetical protein [Spirulina sp. 06S082]